MEDQEDDTGPWIGKGGPIPLLNAGLHDPSPTSTAFIAACRELGYPATDDFNGPKMEGTGWHHVNIRDGSVNWPAVRAALAQAMLDGGCDPRTHD